MNLFQALYIYFVSPIISFLIFVIFVQVVLSWLIGFNVINGHNRFVAMVYDIANRITEPMLRPIRNMLPPVGGMDFSPFILILALYFTRDWLLRGLLFGGLHIF